MKKKRNRLLPPAKRRRNANKNSFYKNKISSLGYSIRKVEAAKRQFLKTLKIDEFGLNDLFFTSVSRWRNFGDSNNSLEMAISRILTTSKPLSLNIRKDILIVHNHTKSIVIYLFEEDGVLWGSTAKLADVGYFRLDKPEYLKLFKAWMKEAMDLAFEKTILGQAV